jgi:tetratricopeptide (TPR) repeat protein
MMKSTLRAALYATAILSAAPVAAETLRVQGVRPADNVALLGVRSVKSDRFTGQDGELFAMMVEDRLRDASFDGEPWLRMLPNGSNEEPDVVLTGYAQAEVTFSKELAKREECVERDNNENCVRKEWVERECRRRKIVMTGQIRFTRPDGTQLYRQEQLDSRSVVICRGDENIVGEETEIRELAGALSAAMTKPLFPYRETRDMRVLERRKDLPKADQALFKTALKATKREPFQACVIWSEMGTRYPNNATLLFNQGLCRESVGDRAGAAAFYQQALAINPKEDYAKKGLSRINYWDSGDAQVAAHFGE